MIALGVIVLQCLACLGIGSVVLTATRIGDGLVADERTAIAFVLGFGLLGWVLFFIGVGGLFSPVPLLILLFVGTAGLVTWRRGSRAGGSAANSAPLTAVEILLLAAIVLALFFDFVEGLSPPADADSLAYHFALPKKFIAAGGLYFVPRAVDGAVPLLVEMTYVPALALGGEKAMTLWSTVSGWAAVALFYQIVRRFVDRRWALALAFILLTTPAVLYGAGSGQTEIRMAMFAMVAAFAVADSIGSNRYGFAALAGLAIGFFMASKYTGLLFAFACALPILAQRHGYRHFMLLCVVGAVAGGQWYVWNWVNTGDPVFPLLTGLPGFEYSQFWDAAHHNAFHTALFDAERAVPINLWWLIAYPFVATFAGYPVFESGRTGFGVFVMLTLPFVIFGLWQFRTRLIRSPLFTVAVITVLFYAAWFLSGSSQRIRHLLPVYPLLLVCAGVAAVRWAEASRNIGPLAAAVVLAGTLQIGGQGLFTLTYLRYLFSNETRMDFLKRTVAGFAPVPWINANLTGSDRIYFVFRNLNYFFDVPAYYGHFANDARIDIRLDASNVDRFWRQLKAQGITHMLVSNVKMPLSSDPGPQFGFEMWRTLYARGCATIEKQITSRQFGSRTLDAQAAEFRTSLVLKLKDGSCPPRSAGSP